MNLELLKDKTILLFGQSRAFSKDEFESQLKVHSINIVYEFRDDVSLIIDGKMMTPYEQIESERIYELKQYDFTAIDIFEESLAKSLDEETLLMSLKLSGDKDRLKAFLQNPKISDELFFKLLKMYNWGEYDFFESDDNRDVSASFISRFYENIERNHNVQYATTGYVHLIKQTKDTNLLEIILSLKPIKKNLNIKMQIAKNEFSSEIILNKLKDDENYEVKEALSLNKNLTKEIVQELIKDKKLCENIAKNINLTDEYFKLLQDSKVALALNESLDLNMQEELYASQNEDIHYALALNNGLKVEILNKLFCSENENIKTALYENKMMPVSVLQDAYKENRFYEQLAKNENTPIDILYQLQLDSKYERYVKTNASFGKYIQEENIGWL